MNKGNIGIGPLKRLATGGKRRVLSAYERVFPSRLHNLYAPRPGHNLERGIPTLEPRGRALLAYITFPWRLTPHHPANLMFSNAGIARTIVQVLNDLGFVVDVISFEDRRFRPSRAYDLFIGHGGINFEGIARRLPAEAVKIYFSTGGYWQFHNDQERARFQALCDRRGVALHLDRPINHSEEWANANAHAIIAVGGPAARDTYSKFPHVFNLNNAAYQDTNYDALGKDFVRGRNRFLFFAGWGNVHKGLDLLLEAFSNLGCHLYVCQRLEPDFVRLYRHELEDLANVHCLGPVALRSPQFYELVNTCNFAVLPSCSEGQPGSIVDCMSYGLIPLVSYESNIDTDGFGVTLRDCTTVEIARTVRELSARPVSWQAEMSRRTRDVASSDFSERAFYENMKRAVTSICEQVRGRTNETSVTRCNRPRI
ncbi:MAG TPA: glycosyltransferase [Thermoleophilia bacterium]|nr:glycosyltransferase [Thermoleophilia bacterium]